MYKMIAAVVAALVATAAWYGLERTVNPPAIQHGIRSLSYSIENAENIVPKSDQAAGKLQRITRDLSTLSERTDAIRLYAAGGLYQQVPAIARRYGMSVTVGAWVGPDHDLDKREIEAAIRAANTNPNVRAIVVGNETILRKDKTVGELIALLRQVRARVRVPVTTGETWDIWLKYPELATEVDYIAAHVLPYWEGIPDGKAAQYALDRYEDLRKAFPGKKIVIAEFGWPSQGYNNRAADTGSTIQASVIRAFLREAQHRGIEYNIIEAFDQPWKGKEGSVGPYWGIYDADGRPKFSFQGTVEERYYWPRTALAVTLGFLVSLGGLSLLRRGPTFLQALALSAASQALMAGVAMAALYPFENYLDVGSAIAWTLGFLLMIPLTVMTLVKIHELADVTLGREPLRLIRGPIKPRPGWDVPKVSIHIPAYREDPDMLIETLDSVAALDYPDFEVLVIVNNTPEEAYWRPIADHCERLGERFKFVYLPKVDGFKAGALNAALPQMAPDAGVIAILDADYVVERDWLKDLVPAFADPAIALVQAPQDHRDAEESPFKSVMNSEYAGFFDIGMVQRNEDNAIVAHGTMLLIRRAAFDAVGGWTTDTITEDTELGLRLLRAGYEALYTNRRYGRGMLPDSFRAFRSQRDRWAYGAVQIMRKHWRAMLPGNPSLSAGQKFQFAAGWSFWLSDSFGVLAAVLNLIWVPMILFVGVLIPTLPFTIPILAMFAVNLLHCAMLYGLRVRIPTVQILGAGLTAMSLQMTVARAVAKGLYRDNLPFLRTDKGGSSKKERKRRQRTAREEAILGVGLAGSAVALYLTNETAMTEINIFAATLAVQSIPFLAAVALLVLEALSNGYGWRIAPAVFRPKRAMLIGERGSAAA